MKADDLKVQKNSYVTLCYKLCAADFKVLEERTATDPLIFLQGHGQLLPAVELVIEGQSPGYRTSIKLSPAQAYGPYHPELVRAVSREQFASHLDLRVGMKFDTVGPDGEPLVVRILNLDDKTVKLDGNHPLAGQELIFELDILSVRQATSEELEEIANLQNDSSGSQLH